MANIQSSKHTFSPLICQFWLRNASTNVLHDFFSVVDSNRLVSDEYGPGSILTRTTLFLNVFRIFSIFNKKLYFEIIKKFKFLYLKFFDYSCHNFSKSKLSGNIKVTTWVSERSMKFRKRRSFTLSISFKNIIKNNKSLNGTIWNFKHNFEKTKPDRFQVSKTTKTSRRNHLLG